MDERSEKAIKKVIEAGKVKPLEVITNPMRGGNISFRFEDEEGKLVAQFSLTSIIKKRVAKRKKG